MPPFDPPDPQAPASQTSPSSAAPDWNTLVPLSKGQAKPTTPATTTPVATPPVTTGTPDWSGLKPLIAQPTGNTIADPANRRFATRSTTPTLDKFGDLVTGATELGGMIAGARFGNVPALEFLPRMLVRAGAAGLGGAAGNVIGRSGTTLLPGGPPPSLDMRPNEMGQAFVQGAAGEGIAAAGAGAWQLTKWGLTQAPSLAARAGLSRVSRVLDKIRAPLGGSLEPPSEKATKLFGPMLQPPAREAEMRGLHPTIAQATTSRLARISENIAEGAFIGGGQYAKALERESVQLQHEIQKELSQFGTPGVVRTAEQRGAMIQAARDTAYKAENAVADAIYEKEVWPLADKLDVQVTLAPIRAYSAEELAKRGLAVDVEGGQGIRFLKKLTGDAGAAENEAMARNAVQTGPAAKKAATYLNTTPEALFNTPKYAAVAEAIYERAGIPTAAMSSDTIPFRAAHYLRSASNSLAADAARSGDYETAYLARQVFARLDDSMTLAANAADPALTKAYAKATESWKLMRKKFEGTALDAIVTSEPRSVVDAIVKPHRVKDIVDARTTLSPDAWGEVQRSVAEKLVENPTRILDEIRKLGPETLDAVFSGSGSSGYHGIAQLGRIIEMYGKKGIGTGKVWIELTQAGAAAGIIFARAPGTGTAILLTPAVLSRILTNPTARQWLTTGLRAGLDETVNPGIKTQVAGQLLSWVEKIGQPPKPPTGATTGAGPQARPTSTGRGGGPGPRAGGPPPGLPATPTAPPAQSSGSTPDLAAKVKRVQERMAAEGYTVVPTSTTRTTSEQQALYAKGRTTPGPRVTNANGTTTPSAHQSGQAEDLAFSVNGKVSWDESLPWALLGKIAKEEGLRWGGDYPSVDRPHVQAGTPPPAAPVKKR